MNLEQSFLLFSIAALFCFNGYSEANMTLALSKEVAEEKYLTSQGFQDVLEKFITASTDTAAKATIQAVQELSVQCKADGANSLAVDSSIDAVISVIKLVAAIGSKIDNLLAVARNLSAKEPEAAVRAIEQGFDFGTDMVFATGVPIFDAQGFALSIVGNAALNGLRNAIISIQKAGTAELQMLDMAKKIATLGIRAGGLGTKESLKSVHETVEATEISVYRYLFRSANEACEGLKEASRASKGINKEVLMPEILDSLRNQISIDSRGALDVIARLNNGLKSALRDLHKKTAIDGAVLINKGLLSTVLGTADAITIAKKAIHEAGKLAAKDTEAAVIAVIKGIQAAKDEIISSAADAFLGLGAAGRVAGKVAIDGLLPAVFEVEHGRVTAYNDLEYAEEIAINSIKIGGLAVDKGILAAVQICEAAGNALYTQFADAGEIGYDVFRSI